MTAAPKMTPQARKQQTQVFPADGSPSRIRRSHESPNPTATPDVPHSDSGHRQALNQNNRENVSAAERPWRCGSRTRAYARSTHEKARTPATPTTEIKSATVANPPNTIALEAVGSQHLRPNVSQRAGAFPQAGPLIVRERFGNGGDQSMRILTCAYKQATGPSLLLFDRLA